MSRRYGRKQKRAARERILDLSYVVHNLQSRLDDARVRHRESLNKVEFLRDQIRLWDGEIRSLLGPYTSFAIDEPTYRVDHPDQIRQMPVLPPISVLPFGPARIVEGSISYHIETMLRFMCELDESAHDRLCRFLTVRVMVGSERTSDTAYYAVSEKIWHQMKRDGPNNPGLQRFIHRIAGDLIRLLVAPPKKRSSM